MNWSELFHGQFHTWICCFELAHKLCKKCRCCRAEESNREPSDLAPCGSPGSLNTQFSLRERAYRFGIKHLAFGGELCNAPRARKQFQPELFFEIHNRLANCRLRNVDTPTRFAIALPLHDCGQTSKMTPSQIDL